MLTTYEKLGWTHTSIGCHWSRGEFYASTVALSDGSKSGYALYRNREMLACFVTWDEIERLADRRSGQDRRKPGVAT
jgi:hypothetical protein